MSHVVASRFGRVLVALWLLAAASTLNAQAASTATTRPTPANVPTVSVFAAVAAEAQASASDANPRPAAFSALVEADAKDLAEYIKWQRQFARESWNWHLSSTKMLMYVVLAIVAFGLFITYLQFTRDDPRNRKRRKAGRANPTGAASPAEPVQEAEAPASKFKFGLDGFEMSSQIIGLLVLGFSLAFFYLYVKVVYPMQEVDLQAQAHGAAHSAPDSTTGK
jgi:hypothetical protein